YFHFIAVSAFKLPNDLFVFVNFVLPRRQSSDHQCCFMLVAGTVFNLECDLVERVGEHDRLFLGEAVAIEGHLKASPAAKNIKPVAQAVARNHRDRAGGWLQFAAIRVESKDWVVTYHGCCSS